ncbi:DNA repair protein RadC [Arcticibacter svalbardensis MN12-7]|uniref:DNA repair protein RadC n=1 Tax=Arcticibacter svalbardensis MN12-7 TaxID=1150600 RepID=R9GWX7_9SPHI|nr:JAB domain-containing protein [Arcticibacter svalbardensis]EOR96256.1 DNA repair protein RadC [Arcticibacter svalbardensis MN12-7]
MEKLKNQLSLFQVSEIAISYTPKFKASERPAIGSSKDAYTIFVQNWDAGKMEYIEEFKVLFLNRANKVLGIFNVSTGGVAGTVADPKVIFGAALKANASSVILAHNHPSGSFRPSQADLNLTRKLIQAAGFLDMSVLDHLIITSEGFISFADEGLL